MCACCHDLLWQQANTHPNQSVLQPQGQDKKQKGAGKLASPIAKKKQQQQQKKNKKKEKEDNKNSKANDGKEPTFSFSDAVYESYR